MASTGPARIVLDTNAALDWLLFDGPAAAGLKQALDAGRLLPVADIGCLAEFDAVLRYPRLKVAEARAQALSAAYRACVEIFVALPAIPSSDAGPRLPRCRDRDDQKFLELAAAARVEFLVSRDRELLRLDRRMRRDFNVALITPADLAIHPRLAAPGG